METRKIAANGVTLTADFDGPADGPCVVLMHGGGQTRHAWRKVCDTLAQQGYRVVAFDARGHGDSDWSADGVYGFDIFVGDLRVLLDQLPPKPVLVGASMGGVVALVTAAQTPEAVSAIVLVDVTPRIDPVGAEKIRGFMTSHSEGFDSLEAAVDAVAEYLPHRPRPKSGAGLLKNLRRRDDGRLYWHWDQRIMGGAHPDRESMALYLEELGAKVAVPTLLVRGADSELVNPEHARAFQDVVAGSEWVDVAGARHMVAGDSNDLFSAAILDFLERVRPVGADAQ